MSDDYHQAPGLSPDQASALDRKLDDGLPASGGVQTLLTFSNDHDFEGPEPFGPTRCAASNAAYNVGAQIVCNLMIEMQ